MLQHDYGSFLRLPWTRVGRGRLEEESGFPFPRLPPTHTKAVGLEAFFHDIVSGLLNRSRNRDRLLRKRLVARVIDDGSTSVIGKKTSELES